MEGERIKRKGEERRKRRKKEMEGEEKRRKKMKGDGMCWKQKARKEG